MKKPTDSGIIFKVFDGRNRLMLATPVRASALELVSEFLGREVKFVAYDTMIDGMCKVTINKEPKQLKTDL